MAIGETYFNKYIVYSSARTSLVILATISNRAVLMVAPSGSFVIDGNRTPSIAGLGKALVKVKRVDDNALGIVAVDS